MSGLTKRYSGGNRILDGLAAKDRAALDEHLNVLTADEPSDLVRRQAPIEAVDFPIDAVFSVIAEFSDGRAYEVGTIGKEGLIGAEIVLNMRRAPRTVLCQIAGRYARVPAARFHDLLTRSSGFRDAVYRALMEQWFLSQQTVACNMGHTLEQRVARWILMTQDQVGRSEFPLRQEYLSIMLGVAPQMVQRPLAVIEYLGGIRCHNEIVLVVDRRQLIETACECYGTEKDGEAAAAAPDFE
jgi:CRP-like cAMP-binding protein